MAILLYAALAAVSQAATVAPGAPAQDIIVKGKPKLVCTSARPTGTRVARARRCVSPEQAAQEAEQSREAMRQAGSIQDVADATACGAGTTKMCE